MPSICAWYDLSPQDIYPRGELNGLIRLDLSHEALLSRLEELSGMKFQLKDETLLTN